MAGQLIVETHSDHLINRVRMDVRDAAVPLSPNDVSILYFERDELEVRIHSLRLDGEGNVLDAPASYGGFFMAEIARSLQALMCAIIDANIVAEAFGAKTTDAGKAFRQRVDEGWLQLVVGGKVLDELDANGAFRDWRATAVQYGKVRVANEDARSGEDTRACRFRSLCVRR